MWMLRLALLTLLLSACSGQRTAAPLPTAPFRVDRGHVPAAALPAPEPCGGRPLRVHFYDVGQALAVLVQLPDGRSVLVDAGEQPSRGNCGSACREWSRRLFDGLERDLPDGRIDLLWITHQHSDHLGNAPEILGRFQVGTYVDNGTRLEARVVRRARAAARRRNVPVVEVGPTNATVPLADSAEVKLSAIVPSTWPRPCKARQNDCSLILRVDYCNSSVLLTGDAEKKLESVLDTGGPATVLQVGHHGSTTSTTSRFVAQVKPRYAVVSSGQVGEGTNGRYCLPRTGPLETLTRALGGPGSQTLRAFDGRVPCSEATSDNWIDLPVSDRLWSTARDGTVTLVTTGDGVFRREAAPSTTEAGKPAPAPADHATGGPLQSAGQPSH